MKPSWALGWALLASSVLASSVLAIGCDDDRGGASPSSSMSATSETTAEATAKASSGLAQLKATVNDEPLALQTALAFSRGGRGIELVFSTATLQCQDVAGNGRMLADGEQYFRLTIGPLLAKDGKETWGIGKLYFDGHTQQGGDIGTIGVSAADPNKSVRGELSVEHHSAANKFMKKPARDLVVKGAFTARGCGTVEDEDGPAARPQKKLKLTVAGKPFSIRAALVEPTSFPDPGHGLLLSTAPASCSDGPSDADLTLKLNIAPDGRVQYAFMAGNVLSSQLNASPSKDGPTIIARPDGPLEGEGEAMPPATIALKDELDVLGYAVAATGEVTALRCRSDQIRPSEKNKKQRK